MSQEPSASTSILNVDTPSWSEIDGILSDKYKSDTEPDVPLPTQSTQDTLVQQPLSSQPTSSRPHTAYYSQPQFREHSFDLSDGEDRPLSSLPTRINDPMATPPRLSSSSSGSFGSTQRDRMARLRRELLEEESRVMANSDQLAHAMRQQVVSALKENPAASNSMQGLDSSQQLSHSLLDEQSRTRLKIAKPPSIHSDHGLTYNSVSVDITPLTEDLLLNSRTERLHSDGGQTISDGQFPNDDMDLDDIIFTPLSDEESKAFATPPKVVRKMDKKLHKPSARYGKGVVTIQSHGKTIGNTEIGSFDETSSLSMIDKDNILGKNRDAVKPLRRHAWSDSETENSMSRSLNKQQYDEIRLRHELAAHKEIVSANRLLEERPRSAFAVLSPSEGKYRPFTAPSSEKVEKFELQAAERFLSEPAGLEKKTSDSSLNSNDYPNLKNSFVSLQNTIMSDIAALRREIVEKQEGTEKLRAEFSDFKHAYYTAMVDKQSAAKQRPDVKIPTSHPPPEKENLAPEHRDTTYSECDSETDMQLATLKALQRSLREQSNERYLRDMEQKLDARSGRTVSSGPNTSIAKVDRMQQSSPAQFSNRSIQTTLSKPRKTADANCNTSDAEEARPRSALATELTSEESDPPQTLEHARVKTRSPIEAERPATRPAPELERARTLEKERPITRTPFADHSNNGDFATPKHTGPEKDSEPDSSLDSTERATRDLFMDILRKKAEMDEAEQSKKKKNNHTSTPKPAHLHAGIKSFTPASVVSDISTLTDGTVDNDVTALNALWKEFMKFVAQSKAVKQQRHKPSNKELCIKVDVEKLQKLQDSFTKETYRKVGKKSGKRLEKKRQPAEVFEVSAGELKGTARGTYALNHTANRSVDSREERINRLISEVIL